MLVLGAGQLFDSGTSSPVLFLDRIFANIKNANIYKKLMTTNNEM